MVGARVDVCVVGAGVAGIACAQGLAQAGHSVLLVERQHPLAPCLKAEKISGEAVQALLRLGFGPALAPVLTPLYDVSVFFEQRYLGRVPMVPPEGGCLYHELVNALRGGLDEAVRFQAGHKVVGLTAQDDGATVRLDDDTEIACRLLIIATGEAHALLGPLGATSEAQIPESTYVSAFTIEGAMTSPDGPTDSLTYHRPIPGSPVGYATFFRVGSTTRANIFCPGPTSDEWRRDLKERPLEALAAQSPPIAEAVQNWRIQGAVMTRKANISRLTPPPLPRVLVLGDAAHIIDPSSGSGVTLAMLEVELLLREVAPRLFAADDFTALALATLYGDARRLHAQQASFTGGRYMYDLVHDRSAQGTRHRLGFVLRHMAQARTQGGGRIARPVPAWPLPARPVYDQFGTVSPDGWRARLRQVAGR